METMSISEAREILDGVKRDWSPEEETLADYLANRVTSEHRAQVINAFGLLLPTYEQAFSVSDAVEERKPATA